MISVITSFRDNILFFSSDITTLPRLHGGPGIGQGVTRLVFQVPCLLLYPRALPAPLPCQLPYTGVHD